MAAGTDHYLEVIKPLGSMSTAEQLLCQLGRAVYETHCQLMATEQPVNSKARQGNAESFHTIWHGFGEKFG